MEDAEIESAKQLVKAYADQLAGQDNDYRQLLDRTKKVLDPLEEEKQSSRINDLELLNAKAQAEMRESHKLELAEQEERHTAEFAL
jgi:hypothetical protein